MKGDVMFDLINGLPLHPLVVHAVVVLLPLAALGTIAVAVRPGWRRSYGWLVVAAAAAATVLLPVATSSGEALEERVGSPGSHAEMGDQLIWFTLPMLALVAALVWLDRRGDTERTPATWVRVLPALAVVAALACSVQVYRVGDSGARAAWGERVAGTSAGAEGR
jgi:uncharacterized membrane protein